MENIKENIGEIERKTKRDRTRKRERAWYKACGQAQSNDVDNGDVLQQELIQYI